MPNFLTLTRILLSIIITSLIIISPSKFSYLISFILFCLAGITDFFDGWYARKNNEVSELGKMLDPIADKILVISVLIALMKNSILSDLNIIPGLIIIYREVFISGLREYLGNKSIKVDVTNQSKWKTTIQFISISGFILFPVIENNAFYLYLLISILLWLSAIMSISTGFSYFRLASDFLKKK
jgi:CDP-diacylglycerol--glycerol-3-phosphate 3-phosphatidyltransferase